MKAYYRMLDQPVDAAVMKEIEEVSDCVVIASLFRAV